jgi:hypothetical protein
MRYIAIMFLRDSSVRVVMVDFLMLIDRGANSQVIRLTLNF